MAEPGEGFMCPLCNGPVLEYGDICAKCTASVHEDQAIAEHEAAYNREQEQQAAEAEFLWHYLNLYPD